MLSYKKCVPTILLFLLNTFCLAQTWVTWQNTGTLNGSGSGVKNSTFTGTATLPNGVVVTITGVISTPNISTTGWRNPEPNDETAVFPVGPDQLATTDAINVMFQRNSSLGITYNNIISLSHDRYARPNLVTYTISTSDGSPVIIDRFSTSDVDGLSSGNTRKYKEFDDSYSISNNVIFSSNSLYEGSDSDWEYGKPDTPPTIDNQSISLPTVQNQAGSGKGVYMFELLKSAFIPSGTKFTQNFPGNYSTVYQNGNRGNEVVGLAIRVSSSSLATTGYCTGNPTPQFAKGLSSTATMNGVTVTRTLSRALYSPGNTGMSLNTYCSTSYAANYAFVRSSDQAAKQSATYTFSTPQNNAQFFLMIMGNNASGSTSDRDEALFTLNDEKGNAINTFTLSKNPPGTDCHNIITINNTTHIVSSTSTSKITSDAAILVNSATPFKSVTITDNRNNLGNNGGYGFYVEICPTSISGACYRPASTGSGTLPVNHGITSLQRAAKSSTDTSNWPLVRRGAWTALEANTKGFVPNRLSDSDVAGIPAANLRAGMMVYNTTQDCLQINTDGTATGWKCFTTAACPTK